MQTRTRLTTPPGQEPAPPPSAGPQGSPGSGGESYVPGLALPTEPTPPSRWRGVIALTVVTVVLTIVAFVAFQLVTAGEDFDPAVGDNPNAPSQPAPQLPDGGEGDS